MTTHLSRLAPAARPSPGAARAVAWLVALLLAVTLAVAGPALTAAPSGSADAAGNRPTPRSFTGFGFDQCVAPSQKAMNAWLRASPFWAVGIYISGKSRGCRSQPNLTPTWVRTQLARGWRLLPITLGPQASCNPHFPRYDDDVKINPSSDRRYKAARGQGRRAASAAVAAADRLGIVRGSTLWYDMEAYDISKKDCRESALAFTAAWTTRVHRLGYVSGVYSSAASHIKAMDDVRVLRPGAWKLPDRIWIARWDGIPNTSTSYIRDDGWRPGGRMKQYRGGHNETHGGVTINIDSNFIDLGKGSVPGKAPSHCGGTRVSFPSYPVLRGGDSSARVAALQCLLKQHGFHDGEVTGTFNAATGEAVRSFRSAKGLGSKPVAHRRTWVALHAIGRTPLMKYGAASESVRRLQRALNAAAAEGLRVNGVFEGKVTAAVKRYQRAVGLPRTGVVTRAVWKRLLAGRR